MQRQLVPTKSGWVLVEGMRMVRFGKSLSFQRYDDQGWPLEEESGWREEDESRTVADALVAIGLERSDAEGTAEVILRDWETRWEFVIPTHPRGPLLAMGALFGLAAVGAVGLIGLAVLWVIGVV